jgi:PEGA domain
MKTRGQRREPGDKGKKLGKIFCLLASVPGLLILAGCASQPAAPVPTAPTPAPPLAILPAVIDEASIEITSEPAGARLIVNNQLVGRTPLRLKLKITPQGFCSDYTAIKARFVAGDATQVSQTVETELTPLEKVPARIYFSPQGAKRQMQ